MKNETKNKGFKTPKNYFNELESNLFGKIEEFSLPKEQGFKVPQDYFDTLDDKIINQVSFSEKETKTIALFSKKTFWYAASIAACAMIIFSLINKPSTTINFQEIEFSSIENYIEEGNLNLHTEELASILIDEDIETNLKTELFSDQEIENYLLENNSDNSLFTE